MDKIEIERIVQLLALAGKDTRGIRQALKAEAEKQAKIESLKRVLRRIE